MVEQLRIDFSSAYPRDIVDPLIDFFVELRENYYLRKHGPAELSGGKFAEACVRLLQYELSGKYTPIGQPIRNMTRELRGFEQAASTYSDSFRLHIPRMLLGIYNLRNRRGVGHLGGDVNPNLADSTVILSVVNWVMAELYRVHYSVSLDEAQKVVDQLVERKLPLIYEVGEIRRVLDPELTAKDQTLILLYSVYPDVLSEADLLRCIEYSSASSYRNRILRALHQQRLINYDDYERTCVILPTGLRYVEDHYEEWLSELNQGG